MENSFDKYKKAKISLCKMVNQFLTCYINVDEAKRLNINTDNEYFVINNYVEVCTHGNSPEGNKAWKFLKLTKEFISHYEIWELQNNIHSENKNADTDYNMMYLEIAILLIDLVIKYYSKELSVEDANRLKIDYDDDLDLFKDHIFVCNNLYESAGESVWSLLSINEDQVPISKFIEIKNKFIESLNNSHNKQRILKKK